MPRKSAPSQPTVQQQQPLNPRTTHYEWGGPFGALMNIFMLPTIVLTVNNLCTTNSLQCSVSQLFSGGTNFNSVLATLWKESLLAIQTASGQLPQAIAICLAWFAFHSAFYLWWPGGPRGFSEPKRAGRTFRLNYNFSAFHSMVISFAIAIFCHYRGIWDMGMLADMYLSLALAAILLSYLFSVMLYAATFRAGTVLLAEGGNSGNHIYDFWVGRELNPRIGELDLKFMFELRPGLIGWTLIATSFVVKAAQANGGNYFANLPILGACLCNVFYVAEGLYFEPGNLTMIDIAYDGFGFMLMFGDIAWVPFLYALQCKFLYLFPQPQLSHPYLVFCALVYILGWNMFRGANSDKDRFRKNPADPKVAHLKTMPTKRGTKLIVSGWWGICRHPNYVGDWLMVLATSLFTGYSTIMPFFQCVYFAVLLIHRQLRDEEWMQKKYGDEDWKEYCKRVPYRLIPMIY